MAFINSQVSSCDSNKFGDNSLTTRKPKGNHNTVSSSWRWFRRYTWLIRSCFPFQSIASLHWVCQGRPSAPAPEKKVLRVYRRPTHTQPQPGMRNSHKWVRVLPTKRIARPQERHLHGVLMTCQLHNAASRHCHPSKPAMQQSIQALRHKTKQQPNKCFHVMWKRSCNSVVTGFRAPPYPVQTLDGLSVLAN